MLDVAEIEYDARSDGETRTGLQNALQCAQLAENEGASPALITAALLHSANSDPSGETARTHGRAEDQQGEGAAETFLSKWFGPEVSEPVRLNAAARRYLSAVEPGYYDGLSPASRRMLMRAGGPMGSAEAAAFEADPFAADALRLLRWQDRCNAEEAPTRNLAHFLPYAMGCMRWAER